MTKFAKLLLAASVAAPAALVAPAAQAQVNGVAVADPDGAIAASKAWLAARTQIQTTYATQLSQADTRSRAIQAELQPLVTQFQTAQRANAAAATLQPQYAAIQAKQQAGQQEIARITAPAERAQAYVVEQIRAKLGEAVQNVIRAKNVTLLVSPQAVLIAQPTADITTAVTAELDRLVPSVSTAVPANWQPGQQGQAAAGTAPGAAPVPAVAPTRRSGGR